MACISCGNPTCRGCHVEHNHVHINHSHADKCGSHGHSHIHSNCSPCGTSTPECESLSSQVTNFTKQFFGEVVKTELNGVINWSLPCSLDVGLENNPRLDGEGLACYFLRLFNEGIIGLTGPEGATGAAGTNGRNAFTVTLAGFVQPSTGSPNVQVLTSYNPAIVEGSYVFIQTSGWYVVNTSDVSGTLFLTLAEAAIGAPAFINAGKLVVPSGFPGQSVVGPQGPQGTAGPQGVQGTTGAQGASGGTTTNNQFYFEDSGTNYELTATYAPVDFTASVATATLTDAGNYLVTVVADILGLVGVALTDVAELKLVNDTTATDVPGSEHFRSQIVNGERDQIVINARVTTLSDNEIITLYGQCDPSAGVVSVVSARTTITYVRIS